MKQKPSETNAHTSTRTSTEIRAELDTLLSQRQVKANHDVLWGQTAEQALFENEKKVAAMETALITKRATMRDEIGQRISETDLKNAEFDFAEQRSRCERIKHDIPINEAIKQLSKELQEVEHAEEIERLANQIGLDLIVVKTPERINAELAFTKTDGFTGQFGDEVAKLKETVGATVSVAAAKLDPLYKAVEDAAAVYCDYKQPTAAALKTFHASRVDLVENLKSFVVVMAEALSMVVRADLVEKATSHNCMTLQEANNVAKEVCSKAISAGMSRSVAEANANSSPLALAVLGKSVNVEAVEAFTNGLQNELLRIANEAAAVISKELEALV